MYSALQDPAVGDLYGIGGGEVRDAITVRPKAKKADGDGRLVRIGPPGRAFDMAVLKIAAQESRIFKIQKTKVVDNVNNLSPWRDI